MLKLGDRIGNSVKKNQISLGNAKILEDRFSLRDVISRANAKTLRDVLPKGNATL